MACPNRDRVLEALFPVGKPANSSVWALLDGARDQRIFYMLRDSGLDYLCLYSGYLPRELQLAAPYMVELIADHEFTRRLIDQAWGNSWGIFVSTHNAPNLRPHLRKFLRVRNEQGQYLLFRYYDPRVLREYLPTCLPDELKQIFGSIECIWMEDHNPVTLIEFQMNQNQLNTRQIPLSLQRTSSPNEEEGTDS